MKKTLVLVLALALVLTLSVIVFAEGAPEDEEIVAEEIVEAETEAADEAVEAPAEEPAEEPVEEPVEEPAGMSSEERELEEWIASLPSSWNATKEEFTFAFILSRMWQYCEEDGAVFVFANNGTQTITLTLAEQYWRHADLTPEEGQALVDAMREDPDISAPYVMLTSDIVTVEIPVGEAVRLSLDPDLLVGSVYGVFNGISATYGSLSASNE